MILGGHWDIPDWLHFDGPARDIVLDRLTDNRLYLGPDRIVTKVVSLLVWERVSFVPYKV